MYSKVLSTHIKGVVIEVVQVECDISNGLPVMDMVGLLASDVKEAKERVRTALKNVGIFIPPKRVTINLSPANIRKKGNVYDLPIAVSIVSAMGLVDKDKAKDILIMGELSLDGRVNKVNGVLPTIAEAKKCGIKKFIIPYENMSEGEIIDGVYIKGVSSILEAIDGINRDDFVFVKKNNNIEYVKEQSDIKDFYEVKGQESVKRAVMIAVAGMHNILMIGAPGCGKSMIAERIPYILPAPNMEECLEITKIQSITGDLKGDGLVTMRPFRSPHHTISKVALVGGGKTPKIGEITMAHNGVLFLDELAEFKGETLDTLRQPLESGKVIINREGGNFVFPAEVMLVAATNPCKCGYYPDRNRCSCSEVDVNRYIHRISGPMLDRMDIWVYIPSVKISDVEKNKCISTIQMREKINRARQLQMKRYMNVDIRYNSRLESKDVEKYCKLGKEENAFISALFDEKDISYRGYYKIIKVARTIADIEGSEDIQVAHLAEAAGYRNDWR